MASPIWKLLSTRPCGCSTTTARPLSPSSNGHEERSSHCSSPSKERSQLCVRHGYLRRQARLRTPLSGKESKALHRANQCPKPVNRLGEHHMLKRNLQSSRVQLSFLTIQRNKSAYNTSFTETCLFLSCLWPVVSYVSACFFQPSCL